jgi:hypothetical protein
MLRSPRLGLTGPTSQWRYSSEHVRRRLDRDPSALFPWFGRGLVTICLIVLSWLDSTRSALPPIDVFARESVVVLWGCSAGRLFDGSAAPGCSVVLLGGRVGRQSRPARLFDGRVDRQSRLARIARRAGLSVSGLSFEGLLCLLRTPGF